MVKDGDKKLEMLKYVKYSEPIKKFEGKNISY